MASAIPQPLRPLFRQHRTSRSSISRNPPDKWTCTKHDNNASSPPRLAHLHPPHYHPAHPLLSLCPRLLLPCLHLHSLRRPRSPPFRHSLPLMTSSHAAATDSTQPSSKTVRVVIKGRVQGVFYRNWTKENATQLGLKGWVRNKRDGSVEALFSGNPDAVQEMEQRCCRGPPEAVVTGLKVFPSSDDPGSGFECKPTV
ncbi:Acylphosphatase [Morella rubra]|uniref:acylphosphatase n=1 Tax=Morella rubra TaxID=262757 RepID=A0A6A1WEH1_9ROSI|nr:Acylphosphatase [Morella rubra]KAB1223657.1 Acylphosphatase [Morella rubra]